MQKKASDKPKSDLVPFNDDLVAFRSTKFGGGREVTT
jgi:hypothetical protein